MTSTALPATAFTYVDSDVADGQTLIGWRRERDAFRTAERRARRANRFPRRLRATR